MHANGKTKQQLVAKLDKNTRITIHLEHINDQLNAITNKCDKLHLALEEMEMLTWPIDMNRRLMARVLKDFCFFAYCSANQDNVVTPTIAHI